MSNEPSNRQSNTESTYPSIHQVNNLQRTTEQPEIQKHIVYKSSSNPAPKHRAKGKIILIVATILIIVILGCGYLMWGKNYINALIQSNTKANTISTYNWKSYTDTQAKLTISYPPNATLKIQHNPAPTLDDILISLPQSQNSFIDVYIQKDTGTHPHSGWMPNTTLKIDGLTCEGEKEDTAIGDVQRPRFDYECIGSGMSYQFTLFAPDDRNTDLFKQIIATTHFQNKTQFTPTPSPVILLTPAVVIPNWTSYRDTDLHIAFQYAPHWQLLTNDFGYLPNGKQGHDPSLQMIDLIFDQSEKTNILINSKSSSTNTIDQLITKEVGNTAVATSVTVAGHQGKRVFQKFSTTQFATYYINYDYGDILVIRLEDDTLDPNNITTFDKFVSTITETN